MHGAAKEDLEQLKGVYPDIPDSLLRLLEIVDGTYWRKYADEKIALPFLGSDVEEYPYFLLSAQQMIETKDDFLTWGDYLIDREFDDVPVDDSDSSFSSSPTCSGVSSEYSAISCVESFPAFSILRADCLFSLSMP